MEKIILGMVIWQTLTCILFFLSNENEELGVSFGLGIWTLIFKVPYVITRTLTRKKCGYYDFINCNTKEKIRVYMDKKIAKLFDTNRDDIDYAIIDWEITAFVKRDNKNILNKKRIKNGLNDIWTSEEIKNIMKK